MSPRNFRCASQHNHPAARYPRTIPANPVQPAMSLSRLRKKRLTNRSGSIPFRRLKMPFVSGRTGRSLHLSVNSLQASVTEPPSLISKTISAFRSAPSSTSPEAARRNALGAHVYQTPCSKEIVMKLKALVFAFAAVLFLSLSARAVTVAPCCDSPACCDGSSCCK
jgi:hypothetical protein